MSRRQGRWNANFARKAIMFVRFGYNTTMAKRFFTHLAAAGLFLTGLLASLPAVDAQP